MTTTKFSVSAAHRITGKSRTTLNKHIKSGKLSIERDADGKPLIDAAELIRCYGADACDFDRAGADAPAGGGQQGPGQRVTSEATTVQRELDTLREERERERRQLTEQIERLQQALDRTHEGHSRALLLIESRGDSAGEWRRAVEKLEQRVANQEEQLRGRLKKARELGRREAVEAIKREPWWRLLMRS